MPIESRTNALTDDTLKSLEQKNKKNEHFGNLFFNLSQMQQKFDRR